MECNQRVVALKKGSVNNKHQAEKGERDVGTTTNQEGRLNAQGALVEGGEGFITPTCPNNSANS